MKIADMFARLTMMRAMILGAFLASLYYFFMFDAGTVQMTGIANSKNEIVTQTKQLAEVNQKLDRAHEYQRSAADMGEALNKLLAYIPENFRLQDFMKTVSEEAKVSGLNIIRVAENHSFQGQKRADFEELSVSIELQGTFSQQMTFLSNLTKQKQIFIVEKFTLDRDAAANNNANEAEIPILNFKAEIHAYRYVGVKTKS